MEGPSLWLELQSFHHFPSKVLCFSKALAWGPQENSWAENNFYSCMSWIVFAKNVSICIEIWWILLFTDQYGICISSWYHNWYCCSQFTMNQVWKYTIILGFWFSRIRSFCFCLNLLISLTTSLSKDHTHPTLVQTLKICFQLQKRHTLSHQMAPSPTKLYWVGESPPMKMIHQRREIAKAKTDIE